MQILEQFKLDSTDVDLLNMDLPDEPELPISFNSERSIQLWRKYDEEVKKWKDAGLYQYALIKHRIVKAIHLCDVNELVDSWTEFKHIPQTIQTAMGLNIPFIDRVVSDIQSNVISLESQYKSKGDSANNRTK